MNGIAEIDLAKTQSPQWVTRSTNLCNLTAGRPAHQHEEHARDDASDDDWASAGQAVTTASNSARSVALDHFGCRIKSARDAIPPERRHSTGTFADRSLVVMAR
jgi:hypothetical protein